MTLIHHQGREKIKVCYDKRIFGSDVRLRFDAATNRRRHLLKHGVDQAASSECREGDKWREPSPDQFKFAWNVDEKNVRDTGCVINVGTVNEDGSHRVGLDRAGSD